MNKNNMETYLNALESGEYTKTIKTIKDRNTGAVCALGVALECGIKDGVPGKWNADGFPKYVSSNGDLFYAFDVNKYLGISIEVDLNIPPHLVDKAGGKNSLHITTLNDEVDFSFQEIAECIRYTYKDELGE